MVTTLNRTFSIILAACASLGCQSALAETVVRGNIYFDETWKAEDGPFVIEGTVTIRPGARVTVEPGAEIRLKNLTMPRIDVFGQMTANGTSGVPIVLSDGMNIYVTEGSAEFSFATSSAFFHGHLLGDADLSVSDSSLQGGSLYAVDGSRATFKSLRLGDSHDIYVGSGSELALADVTIGSSTTYTTIRVVEGSKISARGLAMHKVYGTAISVEGSDASIEGSVVSGGKIGILAQGSNVVVRDSSISGQSDYAAYAAEGAIDASSNFWGDASGPHHPESNPGGAGASVSDRVAFHPWLGTAPSACCSSVLFIPGIKGSRLYSADELGERKLWEPFGDEDLRSLMFDEAGQSAPGIYAKEGDVIDEVYVDLLGPNVYKSFLSDLAGLVDRGVIEDWKAFAYDWRFSARELSLLPSLGSALDALASTSMTGKVSIVAHSNGGLVARSLVNRLEAEGGAGKIDKVVLVAVPQTGAPQAIGALLHGFDEGIPLLASASASRALGASIPGAYGLLPYGIRPSVVLFDAVSSLPWIRRMRDGFGTLIDDPLDLLRFLKDFGDGREDALASPLSMPARLSADMVDAGMSEFSSMEGWVPPSGIRVVQIAGRGLDTMFGLRYYEGSKGGRPTLLYKPLFSAEGDGVVPTFSAWAILPRDNVDRVWIDLRALNSRSLIQRGHSDMLEVPALRSYVLDLLSTAAKVASSSAVGAGFSPLPASGERVRVFLHASSSGLHVWDEDGRHAGVSSDGLVENAIPDVYFRRLGAVQYVDAPRTGGQRIAISSFQEPEHVVVEVDELTNGAVAASTSFQDVLVPTSSMPVIDVGVMGSSAPSIIFEDSDESPVSGATEDSARDVVAPRVGSRRKDVARDDVLILIESPAPQRSTEIRPSLLDRGGEVAGTSTVVDDRSQTPFVALGEVGGEASAKALSLRVSFLEDIGRALEKFGQRLQRMILDGIFWIISLLGR